MPSGRAGRNCAVLGGGDREVNMIQSSSFISLMKVITACGDGGCPGWLRLSAHRWPLSLPELRHGEPTLVFAIHHIALSGGRVLLAVIRVHN